MDELTRFAVYLSHSWWPEDVELNLRVWQALAEDCELLVDAPEDLGPNPPYYINRIEELLRRTDLFSCVLAGAKATDYLQSKRYSKFNVFLSHSIKDDRRRLVEQVVAELKRRQVPTFEYNEHNTAGIDWQTELTAALAKTTHFVALLSDEYERSKFCTYEIDYVMQPDRSVSILPFMLGDRKDAHPKLSAPHHVRLGELSSEAAAARIVKDVMSALDAANRSPRR